MADRIAREAPSILDAAFYDAVGNLVDPENPSLDVLRPDATEFVANGVPVRASLGRFTYTVTIPADEPLGIWTARWSGTVNGTLAEADDQFEVVTGGYIDTESSVPWVTSGEAQQITGLSLSDAELVNAADDVYAYMRWEPVYGTDFASESRHDVRVRRALRNAIAWQAAHRQVNPPTAQLERQAHRERWADYDIWYTASSKESGGGEVPLIAPRVRELLISAGLLERTGHTGTGHGTDEDTFLAVD